VRKNFLTSFLIFSSLSWGETEYVRKRQISGKDLSESLAKEQQIHNTIWEVIIERSGELKFDPSTLTSSVQERFNHHWAQVKDRRLREKFGKAFELSEEVKKTFLEGLEARKDEEFIRFLRLNSLVTSHGFKSHLLGTDGSWTSEVFFSFDQEKLDRFLKRFLSKEAWDYDALYIISEIGLIGLTWKDLGLEKSEDFLSPLRSSWIDLAEKASSSKIEKIDDCIESCFQEFREWLNSSLAQRSLDADSYFRRSLVLKISYSLKKTGSRLQFGELDLEWEGKFILLDGESKKSLYSASIPIVQKTFQQQAFKALNSSIAGHMYRNSKDLFQGLEAVIKSSKRFSRLSYLTLTGHSHLGDVLVFNEKLRKEGEGLSLDPQIDLFTQKEAKILAFYRGEEKSFIDLLSRLKELKSSQSYKIFSEPVGNGFLLKFVAE
jgi:hypothetical protein